MLLLQMFIFFCGIAVTSANKGCQILPLNRGVVTPSPLNEPDIVGFRCKRPFRRYGTIMSMCAKQDIWLPPYPTCVHSGCPDLFQAKLENVRIDYINDNSVARFTCDPGYRRSGPETLLCDGQNWSGHLPQCSKVLLADGLKLHCSFEDEYLCGWSQSINTGAEWIRWTGKVPFNIIIKNKKGHYVYMIPLEQGTKETFAELQSMILPPLLSINLCVEFYYHVIGIDSGNLSVHVRIANNESSQRADQRIFNFQGNRHGGWQRRIWNIPKQKESFQIIFLGTFGHLGGSVALDEITIMDCIKNNHKTKRRKIQTIKPKKNNNEKSRNERNKYKKRKRIIKKSA